jgi:hypothetical protein
LKIENGIIKWTARDVNIHGDFRIKYSPSNEFVDHIRKTEDDGVIGRYVYDIEPLLELEREAPEEIRPQITKHLSEAYVYHKDWDNAVECFKWVFDNSFKEDWSVPEYQIAAALMAGDRDFAMRLITRNKEDLIEDVAWDKTKTERFGWTYEGIRRPHWTKTVEDALAAGYDIGSPEFVALLEPKTDVPGDSGYKGLLWVAALEEIGDFRDDIIYPFIFLSALTEVPKSSSYIEGPIPEGFDKLLDEFSREYPEYNEAAWFQVEAAAVYFYSGRAGDAAEILYGLKDLDPMLSDVKYRMLDGFYGFGDIEREYRDRDEFEDGKAYYAWDEPYTKAGRFGYEAAIVALFFLGDVEKAREYASATAEAYPDTYNGIRAAELVRYCDRYYEEGSGDE